MYVRDAPLHARINEVSVRVSGEGVVKKVEAQTRIQKKGHEASRGYNITFSRRVREGTPLKIRSIQRDNGSGVNLTTVLPALKAVAERVDEHIPDEYEVADVDEVIGELLADGVEAQANVAGRLPEDDREKYEEYKPEGGEE
jgi:hypothetical protein